MPDETMFVAPASPMRDADAAPSAADAAADRALAPGERLMRLWRAASVWSKAACAGFLVAAAALALYAAAGFVSAPAPACAASCALLLFLGALCLMRDARGEASLKRWSRSRPLAAIAAVPIGFYLMERPCNETFPSMEIQGVLISLGVLALAFAIVFVLLQRSRASIALFLGACLLAGVANHFVTLFKGQPILPSDVMALSTALEVSGGYSYALDWPLLESICAFAACCAALAYVPKVKASFGGALASVLVAAAVAGGAYTAFEHVDFEEDLGVKIDVWSAKGAYDSKGAAACFVKGMQDLVPKAPDGYSAPNADALLAQHSAALPTAAAASEASAAAAPSLAHANQTAPAPNAGQAGQSAGVATESAPSVIESAPTVIAIMNESFSDMSSFPTLETSEARPELYYQLAQGAVESGCAYVSVRGGGTCNSEFEFLTCSSNGFLGGGAYPYVQCDLNGTESLVSYFSNLGYATHAIHPNEATNWRRDRIYQQLGFDDFASIEAFEGADTLRDMVTDKETYDAILEMLEADAGPQFIFDVTMQNHGGYKTGLDDDVSLTIDTPAGKTAPELSEYASVIKQSEFDLLDFLEALETVERPIVLCFFGDHQPSFDEALWEETHNGEKIGDVDLETLQECWNTPYMIWVNASARSQLDAYAAPTDFAGLQSAYGRHAVRDEADASDGAADAADAASEGGEATSPENDGGETGSESDASGDGEGEGAHDDAESEGGKPASAEDAGSGNEPEGPTLPEGEAHTNAISLNYLGVRLLTVAGLPLTPYQSCLSEASQLVPAINLNGYLLADGTWHRFNEGGGDSELAAAAEEQLRNLRILQYDNLFNKGLIKSDRWYALR